MNIRALIRNVAAKVCMASVCLLAMSSCDSWLYEEEGDCSVYYRLKFRYDKNLKWLDAFFTRVHQSICMPSTLRAYWHGSGKSR